MTLGNFLTKYGTANNDTLTGGNLEVVFGLAGDDRLTGGSLTLLAGGLGNDTYIVRKGELVGILESGGTDTVIFPFSIVANSGVIASFDNRHLFIGDRATNTQLTIFNWQSPVNRVEKFEFIDGTATYEQVVSQYTSSPSYKGNFAVQQTDSNAEGYLDPATGLTPTTFNSFINNISTLAVTPPVDPITGVDRLKGMTDPIYRFYNTVGGFHFYTASTAERDSIMGNLPQFKYEGSAFKAANKSNTSEQVPLFRFYNMAVGNHFYTTSVEERDSIQAKLPQYKYEGAAFHVLGATANVGTDVFRFFNTKTGAHFYTGSIAERDSVMATLPQYKYEGAAFEVA